MPKALRNVAPALIAVAREARAHDEWPRTGRALHELDAAIEAALGGDDE